MRELLRREGDLFFFRLDDEDNVVRRFELSSYRKWIAVDYWEVEDGMV